MRLKVLWTISNSMGTASDIMMLKNMQDFEIDVITADSKDKDNIGFILTEKRCIIPDYRSQWYIPEILDICDKEKITTIIPQTGTELVPLSENAESFSKKGIKVLVTDDTHMLNIANNKGKTYDFFADSGFVPEYRYVHNLQEIEKAIYELGYPGVPVCIKPLAGEGGKGFRIITEEKINIFENIAQTSKIDWFTMKHYLQKIDKIPELMVMEYLPGIEYSVDCVCKEGKTYLCIPRQRVETAMGVATVSVVDKNEDIIDISKMIISKLNLSYNVNIQFKYSYTGEPKLVEINPRVSGSLITNYGAGVNMLELSLKLAYGIHLGEVVVKWGTKMIRYWDQVFI